MSGLGRSLAAGPFFTLAFACLAAWALWATSAYAVPIALAVLAWFLINGLADALRARISAVRALPRALAQTGAALLLFGAMAIAARLVAQSLADLARDISLADSPVIAQARAALSAAGLDLTVARDAVLEGLRVDELLTAALDIARGLLSDVALIFLYTLFLLIDERFYEAKLRALLPDERRRETLRARLAEISTETRVYLWLMTLVSAGVGLVTYAACAVTGVQGAAVWGFLAFGLNYIPTIGSILGVVAPAVFAALTLSDPAAFLVLAAALAATQFTAGEIVVPRLMGTTLNLSSFVILLTLVAWGALWGPVGMFLAIPITVIAVMVFARFESTRPIAIMLSKTGEVPAADPPRRRRRVVEAAEAAEPDRAGGSGSQAPRADDGDRPAA